MSRVRGANTGPELRVRRIAHRLGYRFRLHSAALPGKPDIVFPRFRSVVFVHGCFWHRHDCKRGSTPPKTRPEYWAAKFAATTRRDQTALRALSEAGWRVLVIWECETRDPAAIESSLCRFLGPRHSG
jgi:DNA mismatch endonuclease (patch repair protein)